MRGIYARLDVHVAGHDVLRAAQQHLNTMVPRDRDKALTVLLPCSVCKAPAGSPCAGKRTHKYRRVKADVAYVASRTVLDFAQAHPVALFYGKPRKVTVRGVPYAVVARYHDVVHGVYILHTRLGIAYSTVTAKVNHVRFVD